MYMQLTLYIFAFQIDLENIFELQRMLISARVESDFNCKRIVEFDYSLDNYYWTRYTRMESHPEDVVKRTTTKGLVA